MSNQKDKQTDRPRVKYDSHNYRLHSDRNKELIRKSLEELGAGRSVVIDAEDELIAGNGVYEQAEALGIKTRVIETDGSELVVVKRTDLKTDDVKRKRLALADNATSDTSEWNKELLKEDWEDDELNDWDISLPEDHNFNVDDFFDHSPDEPTEKEPKKIKCPHCGEEFEL